MSEILEGGFFPCCPTETEGLNMVLTFEKNPRKHQGFQRTRGGWEIEYAAGQANSTNKFNFL